MENTLKNQKKKFIFFNRNRKDYLLAFLFILPTLYLLVKTFVYPVYQTVIWSLYHYNLMDGSATRFIGVQNYTDVLSSVDFWISMNRTVIFTVVSVSLELLLGFYSALLLNQK